MARDPDADAAYRRLVRSVLDAVGLATRLTAALEEAIAALVAAGRIDDTDAAAVEVARGIAIAVTLDPTNAALWREYRATVAALMEAGADDTDDGAADFLVSVSLPPRPAKPRKPRRGGAKVGDPKDT